MNQIKLNKNKIIGRKSANFSLVRSVIFAAIVALVLLLLIKNIIPSLFTTRTQECKTTLIAAKITKGPFNNPIIDIQCPPRYVVLTGNHFIANGKQIVHFWVKNKEYSYIPNNKKNVLFVKEAVENVLANELYTCWDIADQGNYGKSPYANKLFTNLAVALICSKFKIDKNFKIGKKNQLSFTIGEFKEYLANHKIPNKDITYNNYLNNKLSYYVKEGVLSFFNPKTQSQYKGLIICGNKNNQLNCLSNTEINPYNEQTISFLTFQGSKINSDILKFSGISNTYFNVLMPSSFFFKYVNEIKNKKIKDGTHYKFAIAN